MSERTVYQVLKFRMLRADEDIPNGACLYVLEEAQERTWVDQERAKAEAQVLAETNLYRVGFVIRERTIDLSDGAFEFKKELQQPSKSKEFHRIGGRRRRQE